MKNCFWIVWIIDLRTYTEDVTTLLDVVFNVVVCTFIGKLSHLDLLIGKLFIQIVEVQTRRRQFFESRREYRCLESRHGCLKLRWNQSERLMLHTEGLVQLETLWNHISIEFEKSLVE